VTCEYRTHHKHHVCNAFSVKILNVIAFTLFCSMTEMSHLHNSSCRISSQTAQGSSRICRTLCTNPPCCGGRIDRCGQRTRQGHFYAIEGNLRVLRQAQGLPYVRLADW
jgi:hypothetical protein